MFAHLALALVGIGIPAAYTEEPIPDLVFHHPNAVYGGDKSLHASVSSSNFFFLLYF